LSGWELYAVTGQPSIVEHDREHGRKFVQRKTSNRPAPQREGNSPQTKMRRVALRNEDDDVIGHFMIEETEQYNARVNSKRSLSISILVMYSNHNKAIICTYD